MEILIKKVTIAAEKQYVIELCDEAFEKGITKRNNYKVILNKILNNADFFCAYINTEIAGYAAVYTNDIATRSAYVTMIGVIEKYRRCHVGTELLMACVECAKERKMRVLRLEVLNENVSAISFYKYMGFRIEKSASEKSKYMLKELF